MAENEGVLDFVGEQFRRLNLRFDAIEQRLERLESKVETRLANIKRRLTGMSHFDQSIIAHVASIHSGVDNLRADFIGVEQRLTKVEAR